MNIYCAIFTAYDFLKFLFEYIHLHDYQNMSHYHNLHKKLCNEFLLICTHQNLLRVTHPLSQTSRQVIPRRN